MVYGSDAVIGGGISQNSVPVRLRVQIEALIGNFPRVPGVIRRHRLLFFYLRFFLFWQFRLRRRVVSAWFSAGCIRHPAVNRDFKNHRTVEQAEIALAQCCRLTFGSLHIGHVLPLSDIFQAVHHVPLFEIERIFVLLHIVLAVKQRAAQQRSKVAVPGTLITSASRSVPKAAGHRAHRGGLIRADIIIIVIALIAADSAGNTFSRSGCALLDQNHRREYIRIDCCRSACFHQRIGISRKARLREGRVQKCAGNDRCESRARLGLRVIGMGQELKDSDLIDKIPRIQIIGDDLLRSGCPASAVKTGILARLWVIGSRGLGFPRGRCGRRNQ